MNDIHVRTTISELQKSTKCSNGCISNISLNSGCIGDDVKLLNYSTFKYPDTYKKALNSPVLKFAVFISLVFIEPVLH